MKRHNIVACLAILNLLSFRASAQNSPPVALARNISGQPDALVVGTVVSIATEFTDPNGRSDLSNCYLQIGHPSQPITLDLDLKTKVIAVTFSPTAPSGSQYISKITADIREDVTNGYRVTWRFYPRGDWPLTGSGIDFAVKAKDSTGSTDGFNRDGRTLAFRTPAYGTTLIIHGSSLSSGTTPAWVRTMGRGIADRLGSGRVFEYTPATGAWTQIYSVGSDSGYEEVLLLNWTDESLNSAIGYAEAAADTFVASLISRQLANPSRFLLGRIHTIGHSRGTVVASEMIERLAALSAAGEDLRLFGQALDTQIDETTLDPHTSGSVFTGNFGDPDVNQPDLPGQGVAVWNNVGVAANYYQNVADASSFIYLNGEVVPGARNRNLDGPPLVGIDHSEVHAWYYGTINPSATVDELAAMVAESLAAQAKASGISPEMGLLPSLDQLRRMISINRPNWYTDNVGVVEGYAHSRRGGRLPFNDALEPPPDASKIYRPFWEPMGKGVYNGAFDTNGTAAQDVPGWDRHGGGGFGEVDGTAHYLVLSSTQDPTGNVKSLRRHNRLYIPKTASELLFSYRVQQADSGSLPDVDHLILRMGAELFGGGTGKEIWLNAVTPNFADTRITIPEKFKGTVVSVTFEIERGGAALNSAVLIDSIRFGTGGASSTTTTTIVLPTTTRISTTTTTSSTTSSTRATSVTTTSTTSTTRPTTVSTTTSTIAGSTSTTTSATSTTTLKTTLAEPATVQTLSTDPSQGCPGFYIGDVSLAPGAAEGMWGIEILLTAGDRLLQGGLNLGGGFQENGGVNGWGAFSISNPRNERQEVNVQVDAQALDTPGYSPAAFGLSIRLVQRVGQNDIPVGASVSGRPPLSFQRVLDPGFYILEVRSLPGSPRGTFQMAATTKFTDRLGGGFQGGVVVGGFLARNTSGESLHGYAAFCISEGQAVSFQTYGRPSYPGAGASSLVLAIKDRNQQVFWQSAGSPASMPPGVGNLKIVLAPNPAVDDGRGSATYRLYLTETNGVGVTLNSLTFDNDTTNYLSDLLLSRRIEARQTITVNMQTDFRSPLILPVDETWIFRGSDDQGNANLEWRAALRYVPFASTGYGNVNLEFKPNPVIPNDNGRNVFDLVLAETNNVGVNVTGLTINNQDNISVLPTRRIGALATLTVPLYFERSALGYYTWVLTGYDDNGHIGLTWKGWQYALDFLPLWNGVGQQHAASAFGYAPFQFRMYVPADAGRLTVDLAGPSAPTNALNLYVRAGSPVGNTAASFPPAPIADFFLANLGSGSLVIDANSSPRLQTGVNYYLVVYNQATDLPLPYSITATLSGSSVTTTTTAGTSTTTTTISSTTTTRPATSTTTTSSTTTTRPATSTTTTSSTTTTRPATSTTTTLTTTTTTQLVTTTSTTTTRITTTTTSTTSSSTTTRASTTTTTTLRPAFNPNLTLNFSTLQAGSSPDVNFTYSQLKGEINLRSAELLSTAGRLDFAGLTPGKILGSVPVQIPGVPGAPIPVNHVVVSNNGTQVTTKFEASAFGLIVKLADGLFENVGGSGVRLLITIQSINVLGNQAFQDGSVTATDQTVPFSVGKVFTLGSTAGQSFSVTTNFTSVKYPATGGTASTMQRVSPTYVTTP